MDNSYEAIYASYAKFCGSIGQSPLDFETWMHKREEPIKTPAQKVKDFLDSQVHAGAGAV